MKDMENKIDFIKTAISDAQELIRFIDTKTAIIITILGAYIATFFLSIDKIVEFSSGYSNWFWLFMIFFFILVTLCVIVTTRIIKPTNNPVDNINIENKNKPKLKFFLPTNDYSNKMYQSFLNSEKYKLTENFESYLIVLDKADNNDILDSLTLELFKVSYIRNIKNDRFNTLLKLLFITTIVFFISYLFFSIETHNTIENLKVIQKACCH